MDEARPLDAMIGPGLPVGTFLPLAIAVTHAVGRVHQSGLVHKDVKASNILIDAASGAARLTGFGIASRVPRERQPPGPPELIAGTLSHMAPEQTGRMNRSIDSRSDLYSLGITFYHALTGSLPFNASEPMEWVHCHIAKQPAPPTAGPEAIPPQLAAIVMKLLAKTPEDRYQTAGGVEHDLRRCLDDWETHGAIAGFSPGERDHSDRLLIPDKLYGREREIETLLGAFDATVASGTPQLVLVSGYSGIGKSALVSELHRALVARRGLFATGKFDQLKRDVPYATLAQAFQSLIRQLLTKSETELGIWRQDLRDALDQDGQLIVELVPELKLVIGDQPPVPEVAAQDAQRRFQLVFRRFVAVFARQEHPLALFLDDLQWLDAATLDLLEDLLTRSELQHLMLIGAYRDNEVDAAHPLIRKLEAIKKAGGHVQDITLGPLTLQHLGQLLADTLRCEPERSAPLAQLVHEKTGGNPFFTIQFIAALAEEHMLTVDHDAAGWSWDLDRIHTKGFTDNVVDLMITKLSRLPDRTQSALQHLACLGNVAETAALSMVLERSPEEVDAALWESARQGFVERLDGSYKFAHDRVQEAAYSLIPEAARAGAHLRIGRLLAAHTPRDKREEAVFDIVNHLNRGVALITSHEEREDLAELNLIAGKRAKASTAYVAALTFFNAGAALLGEDCWERRRDLIFTLELERAECEFLTGELEAANQRSTAVSRRTANTIERAAVTFLNLDVCTVLLQLERAVAAGLEYLRYVGIECSSHPSDDDVRREYERIWSQLGGRTIEDVMDLPLMSDPDSLATVNILTKMMVPAYLTDRNLDCLTNCMAVNLSLERGNCDASCVAYVMLGRVAVQRFRDYQTGFRFGQVACELVEGRGLQRFQARTYLYFGAMIAPWMKHVRTSAHLQRRAVDAANKFGDLTSANYANIAMNSALLVAGEPLSDVQREAERALASVQKARFSSYLDGVIIQLALIRTLRGSTPTFGCFDSDVLEELPFERNLAGNPYFAIHECWYWIRKMQARYFAGDYAAAIEASSKAQRLLEITSAWIEEAEYHFYSALSRAAFCDSVTAAERVQHLEALAQHQRQLEIWSENCPDNFENRAALVAAEIARLESRDLDAMGWYEKAIDSSRTHGFINNEALAYERASAFYRARGFDQFADLYIRKARACYATWGADGKVSQLDRLHPDVLQDSKPEPPSPGSGSTITAPIERLDLATVIGVSQAVSSEIVLEKLFDTVMRKAMEQAGAERIVLIIPQGDELRIAAESRISGSEVIVSLGEPSSRDMPESILRYVIRTHESVLLDDASSPGTFAADPYFLQHRARSLLCLPLLNQSKLSGVLYLENNLATCVFTSARVTVLKVLVSQAAISLENTRLYRDVQDREARIRRLIDANIIGVSIWHGDGRILDANEEFLRIVGYEREDLVSSRLRWTDLTPPDERDAVLRTLEQVTAGGNQKAEERELLRKDGSRVPVLAGGVTFEGVADEGIGFLVDVTERKRAELALRESEREARLIVETIPGFVASLSPAGEVESISKGAIEYCGQGLEAMQQWGTNGTVHVDDLPHVVELFSRGITSGEPYDFDARIRRRDGIYRWFQVRGLPLRDAAGQIIRWYSLLSDIEDRKRAEAELRALKDQLHRDNIALRDELDRTSMFEEIVGTSPALHPVLTRVAKVAPSDSSVLITGETGTGKELVARAIHRRSARASLAFVSVNCSAIPRELIASELFGHEKGAFTGATERRLGRFELAHGGTIFLDEVGELPMETQVALLRVLQEREFERVGGTSSVRVDVRVVAATNRDLQAAIEDGRFRSDLFYRLNVFPIAVPALRERGDDIPLLVEYFIDRYARKAGKTIRRVNKRTLDHLRSYPWPGNVRELQNVIERSVILCDTDEFTIDESWLSTPPATESRMLSNTLAGHERAIIEDALRASGGRVFGPSGAAERLGIARSTLESKIRGLGIDKDRFRARRTRS